MLFRATQRHVWHLQWISFLQDQVVQMHQRVTLTRLRLRTTDLVRMLLLDTIVTEFH